MFRPLSELPVGPPREIVPLVLYENYLTAVYGRTGVGKGHWLIHQIIVPLLVSGQKICMIVCEDMYSIRGRLEACADLYGAQINTGNLLVRDTLNVLNEEEMKQIRMAMREINPAVFIVDPIGLAIGGADEIKAETARQVRHALKRVNAEVKTTSMYVTHIAKSAKKSSQRGSGVWKDVSDMEILIDGDGNKLRAKCTKWRDGEPWGWIRWDKAKHNGHIVLTDPRQESRSGLKEERKGAVLRAVESGLYATDKDMAAALKIPRASLSRVLKSLTEDGLIESIGGTTNVQGKDLYSGRVESSSDRPGEV